VEDTPMASSDEDWRETFAASIKHLDESLCVVEDGVAKLCIGLRATLYFSQGTDPAVRENVVHVLERYEKEAGSQLRWGADPRTSKPVRLAGTHVADPRTWMQLLDAPEWNLVFHGAEKRDDASPYTFVGLARKLRSYPSWVTFTLPLSWLADRGPAGFLPLVLDCCRILNPIHGYAGFSVIPHVNEAGDTSAMRIIEGLAFRFLGVEVDFPVFHARYLAEAIKGVNWLTVLDDRRLDAVGGRAALAAALGDEFTLHGYGGGAVIQAGPHPIFGDVNRGEDVGLYRRLARALAPIRVDYSDSMASMSGGGFTVERTREWFGRFD
jgi:hypothetical protein